MGNSSIDQVSELMTCDGDVGEKMKVRTGRFILNTLFPHSLLHIHSFDLHIFTEHHSFDLHIFTEQLLCVRCCHKSWGQSEAWRHLFHGTYFLVEKVCTCGPKSESLHSFPRDRAFLVFCSCPGIFLIEHFLDQRDSHE